MLGLAAWDLGRGCRGGEGRPGVAGEVRWRGPPEIRAHRATREERDTDDDGRRRARQPPAGHTSRQLHGARPPTPEDPSPSSFAGWLSNVGKKRTHRAGTTTSSRSGPIKRPPTTTVARGRWT